MAPTFIHSWLRRKRAAESLWSLVTALLALLGGLAVCYVTFWFVYALVYVGWTGISAASDLMFSQRPRLGHEGRMYASGTIMVLLFLASATMGREALSEFPRRDYRPSAGAAAQLGLAGSLVWLLVYPGASAKMIVALLISGPRLMEASWRLLGRAFRLLRLDMSGCSAMLTCLTERGGKVPYSELYEWQWDAFAAQLRDIDGVLFLEDGVSLSADLREELAGRGRTDQYGSVEEDNADRPD